MFEATLNTFRQTGTAKRKLAIMPLALGFHVVVLAGAAMAQMWIVDSVPEPMVMVGFVPSIPLPPAAARPKPAAPPADPQTPVRTAEPFQPKDIPNEIPKPGPNDGGPDNGVPGGDPNGDPDAKGPGIPGGVDPAFTSTAVASAPVDEAPIVIGGEVQPPVMVSRVEPRYPEIARHARLEGIVITEAIIDKSGNVVDVRVLRPLGLGCSEAAVDAIRTWRYRPAMLNGRPVAVYLTVTVRFALTR